MFCPECMTAGKVVRVENIADAFAGSASPDANAIHRHRHAETFYECTRGHSWQVKWKLDCPIPECEWKLPEPEDEAAPFWDKVGLKLRGAA